MFENQNILNIFKRLNINHVLLIKYCLWKTQNVEYSSAHLPSIPSSDNKRLVHHTMHESKICKKIELVILGKCSILSGLCNENTNWKSSSNNIIVACQYNVIIFLCLLWILATETKVYALIFVTSVISHSRSWDYLLTPCSRVLLRS